MKTLYRIIERERTDDERIERVIEVINRDEDLEGRLDELGLPYRPIDALEMDILFDDQPGKDYLLVDAEGKVLQWYDGIKPILLHWLTSLYVDPEEDEALYYSIHSALKRVLSAVHAAQLGMPSTLWEHLVHKPLLRDNRTLLDILSKQHQFDAEI